MGKVFVKGGGVAIAAPAPVTKEALTKKAATIMDGLKAAVKESGKGKKKAALSTPAMPVEVEAHKEKKIKADEFPLISTFKQSIMNELKELMQTDVNLAEAASNITAERAKIKERAIEIMQTAKVPGTRYGRIALYNGGWKQKESLNRGKLLENGVTPAQLEASMVKGKKYYDLKITDLDARKKPGEGEGDD